jgi:hypothetical protein
MECTTQVVRTLCPASGEMALLELRVVVREGAEQVEVERCSLFGEDPVICSQECLHA